MEDFRTLCYEHRASHTGGLKVSDLEGCQNRIKGPHFFVAIFAKGGGIGKKGCEKREGPLKFVWGKKMEKASFLITVCLGLHFNNQFETNLYTS